MLEPKPLKSGAIVRIISTAGTIDSKWVEGAEECLKSWGLIVKRGKFVLEKNGRFAGTDEQRLFDLQEALDDPQTDAIFFSRGGYGTVHLLEKLSLTTFCENPKWLIGFSDITMLHSVLQNNGFASIHGGMAKALALSLGKKDESIERLKNLLFGMHQSFELTPHPLNNIGECKGILTGGNLSILYSLRSTPYDIKSDKRILFIEDIGEKPYEIDRMMYNLKLSGFLANLSGLIVGQFSDYDEDPLFGKTVYEIIKTAVSAYDYPVVFNFPFGHVDTNLPLLCGAEATLIVNNSATKLYYA